MVKLRLSRRGKKGAPHYKIVAIHARTKREGKALDTLGFYNPHTSPSTIEIDAEKAKYWLGNGAQPTDTVKRMLISKGIMEKEDNQKVYAHKPGRKKQERAEAKAADKDSKDKSETDSSKDEKSAETKPQEETKVEEKASDETPAEKDTKETK